jgi:hypothetical protein
MCSYGYATPSMDLTKSQLKKGTKRFGFFVISVSKYLLGKKKKLSALS